MNPLSTLSNAYNTSVNNTNNQYSQDVSKENSYQDQYNTNYNQAQAANQNLQNYTNYMQGAGSATNLYTQGQNNAFAQEGFDPQTLSTATQNLTQSQNALANLYSSQQAGAGGMGRTQAQLGNYYSTLSNPLQQQVSAQGNAVNNLQQLYQNALTNANQYAGLGVQGEQATQTGLNQTYQNYLAEQQAAQSMQQFYGGQAQTEQQFLAGLAPSYTGTYGQIQANQASAANSYASAQATQLQNQALEQYYSSQAYKNYLLYGSTNAPTTTQGPMGGAAATGVIAPGRQAVLNAQGQPIGVQ